MSKDEIFKDASRPIGDFSFNKEVATVFDDMLHRSVPYYQEIQYCDIFFRWYSFCGLVAVK